ncbi:hypothetical protein KIW84_034341 [Lathyrus oleraceus]|uniref:Probable magnesium transporter n=1 Tax=Pisum sativum TaxID=3888 RepID=A0A9D4Y0G6_PEA|nr:hypothetical protein KIW84_034341 [Pisum sativum]
MVATAFIVLGNVFLVAFGNHQSPVYTPEQLTEKYTNVAFLLYLLALIVIVVLNHSVYKRGELLIVVSGHELKPFWSMLLPFSYAEVSGAIGSCSVLLNPENLTKFLKGAVVIDITAFVDQDHPFVEVWNPVSEAIAAYLVAKDLVAVANSFAVAIVQAEIESVASIAAVALVVVTAVLEMITNLMHLVVIAAELEPSIAVTRAQSAGLSACLNWQIEVTGCNFGEIRWMVGSSVSRARHSVASNALPSSYHEFVTKQLMFKSCEAFRMHQRLRKLRHNALNNTLEMGDNICPQLQLVDLQDNQIAYVTVGSQYKNTLM